MLLFTGGRNSSCLVRILKRSDGVSATQKDNWGIINAWVHSAFHQYCLAIYIVFLSELKPSYQRAPACWSVLGQDSELSSGTKGAIPLLTLTFDLFCSHAILEMCSWWQNHTHIGCRLISFDLNLFNKNNMCWSMYPPLTPVSFSPAGVQCFCCDHVRHGDRLPAALCARGVRSLYRKEMVSDSGKNLL